MKKECGHEKKGAHGCGVIGIYLTFTHQVFQSVLLPLSLLQLRSHFEILSLGFCKGSPLVSLSRSMYVE